MTDLKHRPRPLTATTALAALLLTAAAANPPGQGALAETPAPSPAPPPAPSAAPALQEATAEWLGLKEGARVKNSQIVQLNLKINANRKDGGSAAVKTAERIQLENGRFAPGVSSLKGVTVSKDGRSAEIDFGSLPGGTAKQLTLDVVVDGENGQELTAVVTPNIAPEIRLFAVRIEAAERAELSMSARVPASAVPKNSRMVFIRPTVTLTVPRESAPLKDDVSFDLRIDGDEAGVFDALSPAPGNPHRPQHGTPRPEVSVVKDTARRLFHVKVAGFMEARRKALAEGSIPERHLDDDIKAFSLQLHFHLDNTARGARSNTDYDFRIRAENLTVQTRSGRSITTNDPSDDVSRMTGHHSSGTVGSWYQRQSLPRLIPDEKNLSLRPRNKYRGILSAQPGEEIVAVTTSALNRETMSSSPNGFRPVTSYLAIDPGYTQFTGTHVGLQIAGGDIQYFERARLPHFFSWSTDPLPPFGGDFRRMTFHRGGSMPDNATVIAYETNADLYRNPPGGMKDPTQKMDNLYVPVKILGNSIGKDFEGYALSLSAFEFEGRWFSSRHSGIGKHFRHPIKRFGGLTGKSYMIDAVEVAPFHLESSVTSEPPRLGMGETGTVTVKDTVRVREPELYPNRNREHSIQGEIRLPATLELQRDSLPEGAESVVNDDGTTTVRYQVTTPINRPRETRLTVTSRAVGSTAVVEHRNEDVSEFVNRELDGVRASSSHSIPLDGINETRLLKDALATEMSFNGSNAWKITEVNETSTTADRVAVVDILPFNGDSSGSRFHGSAVHDQPLTVSEGTVVYYTAVDPSTVKPDPADPSNLGPTLDTPGSRWSTSVPAGGYTAFMVLHRQQKSGRHLSIEAPFHVTGNLPGDVYQNVAWARSGVGGLNTDLRMIRSAHAIAPAEQSLLQIHKEPLPGILPVAGKTIRYRVVAKNSGRTPAPGVIVEDQGGTGISRGSVRFVETPEGTQADATRWNVGVLAPGETKTAVVEAQLSPDSGGTSTSNRIVIHNPSNPVSPDGSCQANTDVESDTDSCDFAIVESLLPPRLTIDKRLVSPRDVRDRGEVEYRIAVKNSGGVPVRDVSVEDLPGEGLLAGEIVFEHLPEGAAAKGNRVQIPQIDPGQKQEFTVRVRPASQDGGAVTLVNKTRITGPEGLGASSGTACQPNEGLDDDTDGCDIVTTLLPDAKPQPRMLKTGHGGGSGSWTGWLWALGGAGGLAAAAGLFLRRTPRRHPGESQRSE